MFYQPFGHAYTWHNTSDNLIIVNPDISIPNTYTGGITQQATSIVTTTNPDCYEFGAGCYGVYGFQVSLIATSSAVCGLTLVISSINQVHHLRSYCMSTDCFSIAIR
jgi:hypothetical protein